MMYIYILYMQALTFVPEEKPELVDMFARWSMAYSKVLMCHLREDGDVQMELQVSSLQQSLFCIKKKLHVGRLPKLMFLNMLSLRSAAGIAMMDN